MCSRTSAVKATGRPYADLRYGLHAIGFGSGPPEADQPGDEWNCRLWIGAVDVRVKDWSGAQSSMAAIG